MKKQTTNQTKELVKDIFTTPAQQKFKIGDKVKDLSGIEGTIIEMPAGLIRVAFGKDGKSNWRDLNPHQLTPAQTDAAFTGGEKWQRIISFGHSRIVEGDKNICTVFEESEKYSPLIAEAKNMYELLNEIMAELKFHHLERYPEHLNTRAKAILSRIK